MEPSVRVLLRSQIDADNNTLVLRRDILATRELLVKTNLDNTEALIAKVITQQAKGMRHRRVSQHESDNTTL
jgi:hypothetical protein